MAKRLIYLLAVLITSAAYGDLGTKCSQGCVELRPDAERTLHLLLLRDNAQEITLTWELPAAPAERAEYQLIYGNTTQDKLHDGGLLEFQKSGDQWLAERKFSRETLGHGTFIAAVIRESRGNRAIVDWRPFRIRTSEDSRRDSEGVEFPTGGPSVRVVPEFIQVASAHGQLPKHTGGDVKVWHRLPGNECCENIDLDGARTGVPGLTITYSNIWESDGSDWQQQVRENIKSVAKHFVDYDELEYREIDNREVDVGEQIGPVHLKHYYGAITLFTNANAKEFTAQELGRRGKKTYFSHETSANLAQDRDPRLWASYSRREYSADPELLDLIEAGTDTGKAIPGLSHVQKSDGDGGAISYSIAFKARVMPWAVPDGGFVFQPGFIQADVVATRVGFGGVETGAPIESDEGFICSVISCNAGETRVNLNQPPEGYRAYQPMALTGTQKGAVHFFTDDVLVAARALDINEDAIDFPSTVRFSLTAHLRAGALTRIKKKVFSKSVEGITPVNSYAQYIIRYTVAMIPNTVIVNPGEPNVPEIKDFDIKTPTPEPDPRWWENLFDFLGWPGLLIAGVALLLVLWVLVPPLRAVLTALAKLLAAIIDRLTALLSKGKDQ